MYQGIIHAHSTYSYDGQLSLEDLKYFLIERGISFACMSEHTDEMDLPASQEFVAECRRLSDDSFVFVPGFEVPYKDAHILMLGCEMFVSSFADAHELRAWSFNCSLTLLAHPVRNKFRVDGDLLSVLDGVEIWNQQYEGKRVPRTESVSLLASLRQDKPGLLATGGIDFHREEHFGAPQTTMELEALTEENIIAALKAGEYTFGHDTLTIDAKESWTPALGQRLSSRSSIVVINGGKFVNKTLASLGLSLPKSLKRLIRTRV